MQYIFKNILIFLGRKSNTANSTQKHDHKFIVRLCKNLPWSEVHKSFIKLVYLNLSLIVKPYDN